MSLFEHEDKFRSSLWNGIELPTGLARNKSIIGEPFPLGQRPTQRLPEPALPMPQHGEYSSSMLRSAHASTVPPQESVRIIEHRRFSAGLSVDISVGGQRVGVSFALQQDILKVTVK